MGDDFESMSREEGWHDDLPNAIRQLEERWRLMLGEPFHRASSSWIAPAVLQGGRAAVLKFGMPHFEALHEIEGLKFWDGDPTVRLLDADTGLNAMLLERCEPGSPLTEIPEARQAAVIAQLLRRLWREPSSGHPFRSLDAMLIHWQDEAGDPVRDVA